MGGLGSGRRPTGDRFFVEDAVSLDIRAVVRECDEAGYWSGRWAWPMDGAALECSAGVAVTPEELSITYSVQQETGSSRRISQTFTIEQVACALGGSRPYLLCSCRQLGEPCGRRVLRLLWAGTGFACRHCSGLSYISTGVDDVTRARRKAAKLRYRLGGDPTYGPGLPWRPKGMHHITYDRHCARIIEADFQVDRLEARRHQSWLRMVARRFPDFDN